MHGGDEAFSVGEVELILRLFVEREEVDDAECVCNYCMLGISLDA